MGATGAEALRDVFSRWQSVGLAFSSDHVYNWSDSNGEKYIFQPFCLGTVSCSSRVANSKSESASSRRGGKHREQYGDGSAQSVHSRAMLKLPRSNSRSRRVSIPAIRRAFKTWKRWPRSGWKGWRISAHPKCDLSSSAVCAGRRDAKLSHPSVRFGDFHPPHRLRFIGPSQQLFPDGWPVLLQKRWQLLGGHPVHARAPFIGLDSFQCLPHFFGQAIWRCRIASVEYETAVARFPVPFIRR